MSFFDPHSLYYHRQRSTKQGQILQKKPQPKNGAIGYDEIPRSLAVLKTYGYSVFSRDHLFPRHFSLPFSINGSGSFSTLQLTINSIWDYLKTNYTHISDFIAENESYNNASIGIYITSANIIYSVGNARFVFYNNGIMTFNKSFNLNADPDWSALTIVTPRSSSDYYYVGEQNLGSSAAHAEVIIDRRSNPIDVDGVLSYAYLDADWQEINSEEGLQNDIKLLEVINNIDTSIVTSFDISGYVTINLNPQ